MGDRLGIPGVLDIPTLFCQINFRALMEFKRFEKIHIIYLESERGRKLGPAWVSEIRKIYQGIRSYRLASLHAAYPKEHQNYHAVIDRSCYQEAGNAAHELDQVSKQVAACLKRNS